MELVKPGAHPHYSEGLYGGMRGPHGSLAALLVICWARMVFSSLVLLSMDSSLLVVSIGNRGSLACCFCFYAFQWFIYWGPLVFSFKILRLSVTLVISCHVSIYRV